MGYRHLPNSSTQMFGTEQGHYQSHVIAQRPHIHMGGAVAPGNVSMFYSTENALMNRAFCASHRGLECRPVANSLSSVGLENPLQGAVMGPAFDPCPHFPVAGSFYQAPANNFGHAHRSYYNSHSVHEAAGLVNPTTGARRGSFKRKNPSIPVARESGISTFSGAGSSSSSSEQLQKFTYDYQTIEDSRRNVRSRSRLDLESTPRGTYLPTYSYYYSPTTHLPNQSGAVGVANFSAVRTTYEQNHAMLFPAACNRILNSENNGLNQEINQFPVGGSTAEHGRHCHDSVHRRNCVLPPQRQNVPAHAGRVMSSHYSRRAIPYQAGLSFSSLGHETVPLENGPPYRYTRLPSARGWRSYRDERSRIATQRSVSLSNAAYTRDRLGSEAFMMADHSSLHDSRNLFDQYMDMRIDVDNMSYEDLLALGERIGNVSTGLSGDMIPKCLEITCSSSDHKLKENCVICLEEYKSEEEIGTVKNCGHKYHAGCIKEWLLMKNACPICKAPALSDDSLKEH